MTAGDLVKKMLQAHAQGDEQSFQSAARAYIAEEREKKHTILARELEKALNETPHRTLGALPQNGPKETPRDKDRGAFLVEIISPKRSLDSLVLNERTHDVLRRLLHENRKSDALASHGLRAASKILFCGPPGCGKTVAAEVLARELHLPLALVRFDAVVSSYLGETASNMRKVFEFGRTRPMVLLFDEFDAIGKRRASEDDHGEVKRTVNSFLQMLDGYRAEGLTIAATNHQELLDPALWRRFDEILYFDLPDVVQIHQLLQQGYRQIPLAPGVNLGTIATDLAGMSHADVERVIHESIKDMIVHGQLQVHLDNIVEAIHRQQRRTGITERPANGKSKDAKPKQRKR